MWAGMDATVQDQFGQGAAGHFTPHRLEAGDGDGFGGVVDDDIHTGGLFEGTDVAAVATDDASLHFFVGQRHQRGGEFGHVIRRHPLDGIGDQFAGPFFAFFAGFRFDLADDAGHIVAGVLLHFSQQNAAGFFGAQIGHTLQFFHLLFVQFLDLVGPAVDRALALIDCLLALLQPLNPPIQFGPAVLQAFFFFGQFRAQAVDLDFGGL